MCKAYVSKPSVQKVDPSVTNVTGTDISDQNGDAAAIEKKRKQKGFTATQLSTLMSQLVGSSGGKDTLG